MRFARSFSLLTICCSLISAGPAAAQSEIPDSRQNLPPIAAPTATVQVGAISVVRSQSQEVEDYADGLLQGLTSVYRLPGAAFVVARDDHVSVRGLGALKPDTAFAAGSLSDFYATLVVMQAAGAGRIKTGEDVAQVLGEQNMRGITVAQVLSGQKGDSSLLRQIAQKASGRPFAAAVTDGIFEPLGMADSASAGAGFRTTAADMSRLLLAFTNGGRAGGGQLLPAEGIAAMERSQTAPDPVLSGVTLGFAELGRGGWRVLTRGAEAKTPAAQFHLTIVPDAGVAYFVVVLGHAPARFWRALDIALFDKLFPPGTPAPPQPARTGPAPTPAMAADAAGLYELRHGARWALAPFTAAPGRIRVRARSDGALLLSSAPDKVLRPRPGGYWQADAATPAIALTADGLALSTADYRPLPLWKRPIPYGALAVLMVIAGAAAAFLRRRPAGAKNLPNDLPLAFSGAAVVFILVSLLVWLLSPGA